ncbi:MAG TPA: hypothetical protein VF544_12800 [Pyrinomonadaceae bacterium]
MNKLIRSITLGAMVATLALPALTLTQASPVTRTAAETAAAQGEEEAKTALYKKFTDARTTDQKLAYETAKEYLAKYPAEDQYTAYMKKWIAAYEKAIRKPTLNQLVTDQKYAEAYALGKQILADDPNDLLVNRQTAVAGFNLAYTGKEANASEVANYARKTLQLLEAGKTFEEGKPLDPKIKEENIGLLNYALGFLTLKTNQNESINYLLRAAQTDSSFKKDPQTYSQLAVAYQAGPYKKLSDEYQARFPQGSVETPESKAMLENLNQVIDRIIDAYARAIALATDAKYASLKANWNTQLTNFYKFRHNDSTDGLQEMIAGILAKPVPAQPTLVTVPASTPASSGTTGTGTATSTPAASPTPQPASTPQPTTPPSTTSSKPSSPSRP